MTKGSYYLSLGVQGAMSSVKVFWLEVTKNGESSPYLKIADIMRFRHSVYFYLDKETDVTFSLDTSIST